MVPEALRNTFSPPPFFSSPDDHIYIGSIYTIWNILFFFLEGGGVTHWTQTSLYFCISTVFLAIMFWTYIYSFCTYVDPMYFLTSEIQVNLYQLLIWRLN